MVGRSPHRQRRAERLAQSKESRRLQEREEVSGEIWTPEHVTQKRSSRIKADQSLKTSGSVRSAGHDSDSPRGEKTPRLVSSRTAVAERTFSGRIIVLTIVTLVVISFLVPTVRTFVQQQGELSALQNDIAEQQATQVELETELARWNDPDFVRQQARERINLVMPGEKRYMITGDPVSSEPSLDEVPPGEVRNDLPWADALWDSLVRSAVEETPHSSSSSEPDEEQED